MNLILDLKLGYYDFEKEKAQKVKFSLKLIIKIKNHQMIKILNLL